MAEDTRGRGQRNARAIARAVVLPRTWPLAIDLGFADGRGWLVGNLTREVEQRRLFPWIAVCFGSGILLFFQAEGAPALWAPAAVFALCVGSAIALRAKPVALAVTIGLAALFAGFAAGALRARSVAAPILPRVIIAPVSGFVEAVEDREGGKRLLVRVSGIEGVAEAERPRLVRLSVRNGDGLVAGQFVGGTARLLPPPQPAWPGGYDFARDAYFKGIGAVGSFTGAVKRLNPPSAPPWSLAVAAWIDGARNTVTQRIASAIGGAAGGVGAALVTGKRGLIPETTNDVLRGAGIYHIVSRRGCRQCRGEHLWTRDA